MCFLIGSRVEGGALREPFRLPCESLLQPGSVSLVGLAIGGFMVNKSAYLLVSICVPSE